jgi:hypothetical protein
VWNVGFGAGGRVGTLLGPEASGPLIGTPAHVGVSGAPLCGVGRGCWWFWFLPLLWFLLCVGAGGLVGLLFEICIVDASINKNLS